MTAGAPLSARGIAQSPDTEPVAALAGIVRDSQTGARLSGVRIVVSGTANFGFTDDNGIFLITGISPGDREIEITYQGRKSRPMEVVLEAGLQTELFIRIAAEVVSLPEIEVSVEPGYPAGKMSGFEQRRGSEHGYFLTRDDIERREPRYTSDLLRMIPGLRVSRDPVASSGSVSMRGRDCHVDYYVDGMRTPGLNPDNIPAWDIEGIEIYRGISEVPPTFRYPETCAAIVIWTRDPGRP